MSRFTPSRGVKTEVGIQPDTWGASDIFQQGYRSKLMVKIASRAEPTILS
jgi:hypothetical protein